ncbi:MAG TPA: acyltransferase [Polyangiaceae bacterium]|jgi:peptidoglycan/LPS O-acetylase OafA/YrhL|nr:acyltransferase [Polyangiaceae bacterium]
MSTVGAKTGEHFAAVDGLRGIACLAVVAHHCYMHCGRYQWPVIRLGGQTTALSRVLFYGNGGVELFFVVSGFCLAYPLCSRPDAESWQRWFLKRAYRILPPYYASALLFWGMAVVLRKHPFSLFGMLSPPASAAPIRELFVCLTLLNVYFNPSYWTLVLEARWYLLFPLLTTLWRRAGTVLLLVACFLACAAGLWLSTSSPRFVLLTANVMVFLPIFGSGMVIARWTANQRTPRWLLRSGPLGLLASVLLVAFTVPSDGSTGLIPLVIPWGFVAFFALLSVLHSPRLSAVARTPVLVGVGTFSYSLYLIHEPIVHLAYAMLRQRQLTPVEQFLVYECGVLPFSVGLGYVFYRLVERPLVQGGRRVFKRAPVPAPVQPLPLEANTDR